MQPVVNQPSSALVPEQRGKQFVAVLAVELISPYACPQWAITNLSGKAAAGVGEQWLQRFCTEQNHSLDRLPNPPGQPPLDAQPISDVQ
jgi:hypothetical protein